MNRFQKKCILLVAAISFSSFGAAIGAHAQCLIPNQLTNGQTADAAQVMGNFAAVVNCLGTLGPGGSTSALQFNAGNGSFSGVGPLTNGQLAIGSTGNPPQAATLTAGPGIAITNSPGSISISTTGGLAGGLYSQVMSSTPTSAGTGLLNWRNQGTSTVADTAVGITLNVPSASGGAAVRYMAAPTPPYTITALLAFTRNDGSNNCGAGIGWYDGSAKLDLLDYVNNHGGGPYLAAEKWNSPTSWNGYYAQTASNMTAQPIWLRIADDGTNVSFAFSQDGANFLQFFSVAKASGFLGATGYSNVVFFATGCSGSTISTLMSWAKN